MGRGELGVPGQSACTRKGRLVGSVVGRIPQYADPSRDDHAGCLLRSVFGINSGGKERKESGLDRGRSCSATESQQRPQAMLLR